MNNDGDLGRVADIFVAKRSNQAAPAFAEDQKKAAERVLNLEPVVEAPKAISEVISEPQVVSEPEIVLEPEVVDTTVYQKEIVLHIEEN